MRDWLPFGAAPGPVAPVAGQELAIGGTGEFAVEMLEAVVAGSEREPPGPVAMVDGRVFCRSAPCTKSLPVGGHTMSRSLCLSEDDSRPVKSSRQQKRVSMALPALFGSVDVETALRALRTSAPSRVSTARILSFPETGSAAVSAARRWCIAERRLTPSRPL